MLCISSRLENHVEVAQEVGGCWTWSRNQMQNRWLIYGGGEHGTERNETSKRRKRTEGDGICDDWDGWPRAALKEGEGRRGDDSIQVRRSQAATKMIGSPRLVVPVYRLL
jgi:hypothetical protein